MSSPTVLSLSEILKNEVIGVGNIGTVFKALRGNGDLIAIKPIRFFNKSHQKEKISFLNEQI